MNKNQSLSKKEQELYNLVCTYKDIVTLKVIKKELSEAHLGALGKLISKELVEKKKKRPKENELRIYGAKMIAYYSKKES